MLSLGIELRFLTQFNAKLGLVSEAYNALFFEAESLLANVSLDGITEANIFISLSCALTTDILLAFANILLS